ncbi:hypothetical protein FOYG_12113 [Fusarium oxysporum NRRL 32931]|uniref:Uncharacterized protein n=1 Tax=Fusarium oxysporum NRRL 32931 TaxID=660029 RepID=W9HQV7_FUSOX|nr:hypothetical protein FOYG_12113 [Fusarium oxysporum NRRL 32931]
MRSRQAPSSKQQGLRSISGDQEISEFPRAHGLWASIELFPVCSTHAFLAESSFAKRQAGWLRGRGLIQLGMNKEKEKKKKKKKKKKKPYL